MYEYGSSVLLQWKIWITSWSGFVKLSEFGLAASQPKRQTSRSTASRRAVEPDARRLSKDLQQQWHVPWTVMMMNMHKIVTLFVLMQLLKPVAVAQTKQLLSSMSEHHKQIFENYLLKFGFFSGFQKICWAHLIKAHKAIVLLQVCSSRIMFSHRHNHSDTMNFAFAVSSKALTSCMPLVRDRSPSLFQSKLISSNQLSSWTILTSNSSLTLALPPQLALPAKQQERWGAEVLHLQCVSLHIAEAHGWSQFGYFGRITMMFI